MPACCTRVLVKGLGLGSDPRVADSLKTPYLMADSSEKKFTVKVSLEVMPKGYTLAEGEEPGVIFSLIAACFRVPEGKTVR